MPKKKTGARKKAEKQKERQRGIRESRDRPITEYFCNVIMVGSYDLHVGQIFIRLDFILKLFCYVQRNEVLLFFIFFLINRSAISVKGKDDTCIF